MKNFIAISFCLFVISIFNLNAQHVFEAGTGWQNTGATYKDTWRPGIQGSRKDIPVYVGWRYIGQKRVYYTPTARFSYTNTWSIGGGMNLISAGLSPAGIGFYLTKAPAAYKPEDRVGKWFVSANINASFRFGVNVTPNKPKNSKIPDAKAYQQNLPWLLDHQDSLGITLYDFEQHYAFGPYGYVALDIPIQIHVSTYLKNGLGVGFFLESNAASFEWSMDGKGYPYAYGYNMTAGVSFTLPQKFSLGKKQ
jgi:hypothetical protein